MAKSILRETGLGQPESSPQDLYDWYTKLAGARKRTPLSREEYDKVPLDAWTQMLGFKRAEPSESPMLQRKEIGRLSRPS